MEFHIKEGVIIASKKNRPLNAFQFNALAIILLLVIMPFAVAFISNLGGSEGAEYEDSFNHFEPYDASYAGVPAWWWNNGGDNFSSLYTGSCAYIVEGYCTDTLGMWPAATITPPVFDSFFHDAPGLILQQTHARGSGYGTDPYIGSSGDGPFEWLIPKGSQNGIQNDVAFDKLKFGFIDHQNTYNCNTHNWANITIEHSITFTYNNKTKTFTNFLTDTSNKFLHYPYPTYASECNIGFYLEYDFNSFESLELVNWNGGNWNETDFYIKINDIDLETGLSIANAELPFSGTGVFTFTSQYSPIDEVKANFFINMGTLVLSVGTFLLGLASTPYWDPFKQSFRGVQ